MHEFFPRDVSLPPQILPFSAGSELQHLLASAAVIKTGKENDQ